MKKKLRIGLLVDSFSIPNWAHLMVKKISESNHSEIVVVVKRKTPVTKAKDSFLFNLYNKFEDVFFKVKDDAFLRKDLKEIISADVIQVEPKYTQLNDEIHKHDIDKILEFDIDVLIKLGFNNLKGDILTLPKFGVWNLVHSDDKVKRGGSEGSFEVFEQRIENGTILEILTDNDDSYKIYESYSKTDKISIRKNNSSYFWKSASFIPRKLKDLHEQGKDQFLTNTSKLNTPPYFYYNKTYSNPSNYEVFIGFIKNFTNAIKRNVNALFYFNQWILLFSLEKQNKLSQSFYKYKRMLPPKDRFWADPFLYFKNGKYYIFLEELLYKENKGKIAVIEMNENGEYSNSKVIIEKDYHLSYPFLIEDNDNLYMIPESSENNTIEIYKCTNFPYDWKLHKVLIENINAVDTTILKHNGKYWLFCNIVENKGASSYDELFLFYSDSLLESNFIPHPLNPIISDAKAARPAGNIFKYDGKLFRPAQNCTKVYGYGMQIREIITLTETEYEEKQVQSIYPNWEKDLIATHTLNHVNKLTVIDAMIKRRK